MTSSSRLPDFYIVGAQKSGTASLSSLLSVRKDVFLCSSRMPMFFCRDDAATHPHTLSGYGTELCWLLGSQAQPEKTAHPSMTGFVVWLGVVRHRPCVSIHAARNLEPALTEATRFDAMPFTFGKHLFDEPGSYLACGSRRRFVNE